LRQKITAYLPSPDGPRSVLPHASTSLSFHRMPVFLASMTGAKCPPRHTRIIQESCCCNGRYAAATSLASSHTRPGGRVRTSAFLNCLWALRSRESQRTKTPDPFYLSFLPAYAPSEEQRKQRADASRHVECARFLLTNSVAICLLRCPPLEEFLLRFSLSLPLFLLMAEFSITHFWARFSLGTKQQDSA
jgi:hypothetical protein